MNPDPSAGPPHAPAERRPRPRVAKGPSRPQYLHALDNDRLVMMITALAAEVSALRDRLATHEVLAGRGGRATSDAVDAHVAEPEEEARREAERIAMLKRVYRVVTEELDAVRHGTKAKAWASPEDWDGP